MAPDTPAFTEVILPVKRTRVKSEKLALTSLNLGHGK